MEIDKNMLKYMEEGRTLKKILTYGTFDLLHWGHVNLLMRARELGDHLTVGLSTDEFNAIKKKKSYYTYENRKLILESIRYVDKVIPEQNWGQKINDVLQNDIDLFVMGDDWKGQFDFLKEYCEVLYLPRTVDVSTTKIKKDLFSVFYA
jgi:glycerol-3-phosphate cytidylyltransferase